MSNKKKLILIGLCVVIILLVLTVNVIRIMKNPGQSHGDEEATVNENVITRAEAFRLLSYLEYNKAERDALPMAITYSDKSMSDWYDSYLNAVCKMGLIGDNITVNPNEALTYGACKELLDKLIMKYPNFQNVYSKLTFDFMKAQEGMLIPEFLELYNDILSTYPEGEKPVEEQMLFVLGEEKAEDGPDRLVADSGKYYYSDAKNYAKYHGQEADSAEAVTSDFAKTYLDMGVNALVSGTEIIYITRATDEKITLHNIWIKQGSGTKIETYANGIHKTFEAKFPVSEKDNIANMIGDITIEKKQVVQISKKPETINGKVLRTGTDFIEVEGYGKLLLDKDYRIYKIYGDISMEETNGILVGYDTTDFVVSDGKISAALIRESIKAENIRVLISTTDFGSYYHENIEITSTDGFVVKTEAGEKTYTKDENLVIKPGDDILKKGRIKVSPSKEDGKIQILSIKRSEENPKYRGTLEISEDKKGLLIVNDLPLEEYLYAVIPSEMPTYYGTEALKVQAICARSYAYNHLLANSLNQYGAHVDDSVTFQVYNNIPENEDSILAVKDTYGKVIKYDDKIITAYYFSTSCGHTTNIENVWANGAKTPYLKGKYMINEKDEIKTTSKGNDMDLSIEKNFRSFIMDNSITAYDSEFNWYRWNVTMDVSNLKKVIDDKLATRYEVNPDLILTLKEGKKESSEDSFESVPIKTVGDIKDIKVLKRGEGGIITELFIKGSEASIKIKTEYNVRALLAPTYDIVYRKDESKVDKLSILPSAFFIIDKNKLGGNLKSITLTGGGYGHGVGMSQNGVKGMADIGKKYDEIIQYFYEGTKIGYIYE